ncbi:MAG TPA: hypothetical protein DEB39_14750 [Planctomycetaceae bacterium]|nr:hypothetical protein [Planctomycetaceae bacterium]
MSMTLSTAIKPMILLKRCKKDVVCPAIALGILAFLGVDLQAENRSHWQELGITGFQPSVEAFVHPESGFTHPGVGMTKVYLDTMQKHVRAGNEPWLGAFRAFRKNGRTHINAAMHYTGVAEIPWGPPGDPHARAVRRDADVAFRQIIMWYVTGDERYRLRALEVLRQYRHLKSCITHWDEGIHWGCIIWKFCFTAEVLRYTQGQTEESRWTEEDTADLKRIIGMTRGFFDRTWLWMNQHTIANQATLSAAIFLDDKEWYAVGVERIMVNKLGDHGGANGSLKYQIREITEHPFSGRKIDPPNLQLVESGRDLGHAWGNVGALSTCVRIIHSQGTRVDPETGEVSRSSNAVDPFQFLDDRLLAGTDYIARYNYGIDVTYVPCRVRIKDNVYFQKIAYENDRGRIDSYSGILYNHYRYEKTWDRNDERFQYVAQAYETRLPENDSQDFFGNATLLFTPEAALDDPPVAKVFPSHPSETVRTLAAIGSVRHGKVAILEEDGFPFVRADATGDGASFAVPRQGFPRTGIVSLKYRSNGSCRLELARTLAQRPLRTLFLPDTGGDWKQFDFVLPTACHRSNTAIYTLQGGATQVDLGTLDFAPGEQALRILSVETHPKVVRERDFDQVDRHYFHTGTEYRIAFPADKDRAAFSFEGLPETATVGNDGTIRWTPQKRNVADPHIITLTATFGDRIVKRQYEWRMFDVPGEFARRFANDYKKQARYTPESLKAYQATVKRMLAVLKRPKMADDFADTVEEIRTATKSLSPICIKNLKPIFEMKFDGTLHEEAGAVLENEVTLKTFEYRPVSPDYAEFILGKTGQALQLKGDSYLELGRSRKLQPRKMTFSCWLKAPENFYGTQVIFWARGFVGDNGWHLLTRDDAPLEFSVGAAVESDRPYELTVRGNRNDFFPTDRWVHVAVTFDPDKEEALLYIDGKRLEPKHVRGVKEKAMILETDVTKTIGLEGESYLTGMSRFAYDEMRLYNGAATPEEIQALAKGEEP